MLAEEGYMGLALDLFGVKAKLDGFEDYRRETVFLYKNRKEFRKRIKSGLIEARKNVRKFKESIYYWILFWWSSGTRNCKEWRRNDRFFSFHGGLKTPEGQN